MLDRQTRRLEYSTHFYSGWRRDLARLAGDGPGVYIARRVDVLLYIGKSSNLSHRLTQHHLKWMSCCTSMFPTHFEIIDTASIEEATRIEADLIRSLRPPLNRRQEIGEKTKVHQGPGKTGRGWCVRQVETDLLDGWYFLGGEDKQRMLDYWRGVFPEYTHEIVSASDSVLRLNDENRINGCAEYQRRVIFRVAS